MSLPRSDTALSVSSTTTGANKEKKNVQIVNNKYIDVDKLEKYLEDKYPNQWSFRVKHGTFEITAPEKIPEETLDSMC